MAFGFGGMSNTQSRMGQMGRGNRPYDAPSLGGRFGGQGQAPPSGGSFRFGKPGIGPSNPGGMLGAIGNAARTMRPPMPPQAKGNAFGRMMNPGQSRRIIRPPMGEQSYTPPPPMEPPPMMEAGGLGPDQGWLQRLMGGMGPIRRMM